MVTGSLTPLGPCYTAVRRDWDGKYFRSSAADANAIFGLFLHILISVLYVRFKILALHVLN